MTHVWVLCTKYSNTNPPILPVNVPFPSHAPACSSLSQWRHFFFLTFETVVNSALVNTVSCKNTPQSFSCHSLFPVTFSTKNVVFFPCSVSPALLPLSNFLKKRSSAHNFWFYCLWAIFISLLYFLISCTEDKNHFKKCISFALLNFFALTTMRLPLVTYKPAQQLDKLWLCGHGCHKQVFFF